MNYLQSMTSEFRRKYFDTCMLCSVQHVENRTGGSSAFFRKCCCSRNHFILDRKKRRFGRTEGQCVNCKKKFANECLILHCCYWSSCNVRLEREEGRKSRLEQCGTRSAIREHEPRETGSWITRALELITDHSFVTRLRPFSWRVHSPILVYHWSPLGLNRDF